MGGISPIFVVELKDVRNRSNNCTYNLGYLLGARAVCTGRRTTPNKNTKHIQTWNNWQQYIPKNSFKSPEYANKHKTHQKTIPPCKALKTTAQPHIFPTGNSPAEPTATAQGLELRMNGEAHGLALGGAGPAQLGAQGHGCQDDLVVGEVVPEKTGSIFKA